MLQIVQRGIDLVSQAIGEREITGRLPGILRIKIVEEGVRVDD